MIHRDDQSANPWNANLFGTLWEFREPVGLLVPAVAGHSFKFHVSELAEFGKLRSIDKDAVQNFIRTKAGGVYRVAFMTQTRSGRIWISLHTARLRVPSLYADGNQSRRLQVMAWLPVLSASEVPAAEIEQLAKNLS